MAAERGLAPLRKFFQKIRKKNKKSLDELNAVLYFAKCKIYFLAMHLGKIRDLIVCFMGEGWSRMSSLS
jgi:hypothetical protein